MERIDPRSRTDRFGSRINRDHSPILAHSLPWVSIMLGSLTAFLPIISPGPVLPPMAFLMLLAWRMLRPGLLPMWAGFPLGLFDDLFSGQPLGSGIVLFSLAFVALELLDARLPWRGFVLDWLAAAALITIYLLAAATISGARITEVQLAVILPQILLSIAIFPIVSRFVSMLDRLRLMRVRRIG